AKQSASAITGSPLFGRRIEFVAVRAATGPVMAAPVGPIGPVNPRGPWGPVGPVTPIKPASPIEPVWPCEPGGPADPVGPTAPIGPVGPTGPLQCLASFRGMCRHSEVASDADSREHTMIAQTARVERIGSRRKQHKAVR